MTGNGTLKTQGATRQVGLTISEDDAEGRLWDHSNPLALADYLARAAGLALQRLPESTVAGQPRGAHRGKNAFRSTYFAP